MDGAGRRYLTYTKNIPYPYNSVPLALKTKNGVLNLIKQGDTFSGKPEVTHL